MVILATPLGALNGLLFSTLLLAKPLYAQNATTSSPAALFTLPNESTVGANVIPNINDPQAINAQDVCPGYKGSDVRRSDYGLTATLKLAGQACNVYGNDIETLNLTVTYQASDR